jgi:very-short-patch-repair endonuclease
MDELAGPTAVTKFSHGLRREMTNAEELLWRHLHMERLGSFRFRWQHPLENFVVDFICLEALLVLEIDGGQHAGYDDCDAVRTQWLETKGLRVMRFWSHEVLNNIEGVKLAIWNYLSELQPLSLSSAFRGDGAACGHEGV